MVFRRLGFSPFFSPLRYAAAKRRVKVAFINTLPPQTGDVIVNPINPENPDSNNWLMRA
jgi:hypothetical protein